MTVPHFQSRDFGRCARAAALVAALLALGLALISLEAAARAQAHGTLTSVNEYGNLKMQHSQGATVEEQGTGSGTFSCTVSIQMTLSGTLVTASYLAHPHGGSIRGSALAHIHSASTAAAVFSGTITLRGGSGSYATSSGTASFSGTINRTSYAMSIHIAGRLHL